MNVCGKRDVLVKRLFIAYHFIDKKIEIQEIKDVFVTINNKTE